MKKILMGCLVFALSSNLFASKEIVVLIDSSTKLNKKKVQKSISKVLKFDKKNKDKNFIYYGDSVSLFLMGAYAEDLDTKYFDNFEFVNIRKVRKSFSKRKKASIKLISKLSGKKIGKIVKFPPSDIVFCMDNSGSMYAKNAQNNKKAKEVAIQLIDSIHSKKSRVAIVTFGDTAKVVQGFTSNKIKLKKSFNKIKAGNFATNMSSGLSESCNLLNASSAKIKKLILLSDGLPADQSKALQRASACKSNKIEIIPVALEGSDVKYLDKISSNNVTLNANNVNLNSKIQALQGLPTPMIETLYYMSDSLQNYDQRAIIIFSSMMQNSQQYNFYTEQNLRSQSTINKFISQLKKDKQLPNFNNTKIYIQGYSKELGTEKNSDLKAFWQAYFKASGAELVSWAPNSINLKK
jgi:uncharacterized protein YegL